jgi:hypothetical protein
MKFVHVKADGKEIFCEVFTKSDIDYCKNSPRWKEVVEKEQVVKESAKNVYPKKEEPKIEDVKDVDEK